MNTFWDNVLRVVAVIGLLAVLLLGAWGIIQIAFLIPSFFGNIGGAIGGVFGHGGTPAKVESISVSVPASVSQQQPFPITWAHMNKSGEYSYAVSYSCEAGLTIVTPVPAGSWNEVKCNTPFNYINASTSLPVVAILSSGTKTAHPTFTVTATQLSSGKATVHGTTATTVTGTTTSTTATKPATTTKKPTTTTKPASTYYPSGRTTNLYGYSDLAVGINSAQSVQGNVTVIFTVTNVGTNVSPANWTLSATLPVNGSYVYPSGPQQALYPGDKIVYTLRYSGDSYNTNNNYYNCGQPYGYVPQPYGGFNYPCSGYTGSGSSYGGLQNVSIQVDPFNLVIESNKYNNYASTAYQAY